VRVSGALSVRCAAAADGPEAANAAAQMSSYVMDQRFAFSGAGSPVMASGAALKTDWKLSSDGVMLREL
jgi:hypothetical protein